MNPQILSIAGRLTQRVSAFGDFFRHLYWRTRLQKLGQGSYIYSRAIIYLPRRVSIGNNVNINDFVHIRGGGGVEIGDDCLLAPHVVISSQTHDIDALNKGLSYRQTNLALPIRIGHNVWIGAGAVVLPGVRIGDGAVVAAGAVVNRNVDPRVLVAGVPARFVKSL